MALTAATSAVATIVLATAAAAVEAALISDDTVTLLMHGEQSMADSRLDGYDIMPQSTCSKNGNRNKNETKDIGIQASDAILQLSVGYWLIAYLLSASFTFVVGHIMF